MDAVVALADAFEAAWRDEYESLSQVLADLTSQEAIWQPEDYAGLEHDTGVGSPGTILWHLNHLEWCHRTYLEVLKHRPVQDTPDLPAPGELELEAILTALDQSNSALLARYRALSISDLEDKLNPRRNVANFISMTTRHLAWHAAQIAQTRRLYTTH